MKSHVGLRIDAEAGAIELDVTHLDASEELSVLFRYEILCRDRADGPPASALLARPAHVTLADSFGAERAVHGIVAEVERTSFDDGGAGVRLVVRPAAWTMSLGRDCRTFSTCSIVDVVRRTLSRWPVATRWELSDVYGEEEYHAQYREDDWTFVARLLEEAGIFFWFDHDEGETTLVLSDQSDAAPALVGGAAVSFADAAGMRVDRETIEALGTFARARPTRFAVASFDPVRPRLPLRAGAGDGRLEVYDAPGAGVKDPDALAAVARRRLEAARASQSGVRGVTASVRFVPGRSVEIVGHPDDRFAGEWLVVSSRIVARQRAATAASRPLECRFTAIPLRVPFRPEERTAPARQAGLQSGVVIGAPGEEIFPDPSGRVRVQLHWDREGRRDAASGTWMRVAQRGTSDSMLLPRVGWSVLTYNEEGSIDAPSVLSRIHDGEHPPSYPLPANKTRTVFCTATTPGGGSSNEIRFEDSKGAEEMFFHASKDMNFVVRNDKTESVGRDATRAVAVNHDLTVGSTFSELTRNDQSVAIGASEIHTVVGGRTKAVGGSERETVGGGRKLETSAAHTTTVAKSRTVSVGTALVDTTVGPVACASGSTTKILVGGAAVRVSAASISESVMLAAVQTIGGAKLELCRKSRGITVKKKHLETVGGAMLLRTAGAFSDSASVASNVVVGGTLSVDAKDVVIQADDRIVVSCGSSSITITADTIELRGAKLDLSASKMLDALAPRIEHH